MLLVGGQAVKKFNWCPGFWSKWAPINHPIQIWSPVNLQNDSTMRNPCPKTHCFHIDLVSSRCCFCTFLLECDPGWRWWDDLVEGMDPVFLLSRSPSLRSGTIIKEMSRRLSADLLLHWMKHIIFGFQPPHSMKVMKVVRFCIWTHTQLPGMKNKKQKQSNQKTSWSKLKMCPSQLLTSDN